VSPQVTFETSFFQPLPNEDEETNPGRYGKALANWLAERLRERGVAVEGVITEDFGWLVVVTRKPFFLWLGCGNTHGSTVEWSIFPVAEPSLFQTIFKRVDPSAKIEELRVHLCELVPLIPGVSHIVWE
jgi:hypothetical protein